MKKILDIITGIILLVMFGIIIATVFSREIFGSSSAWSVELSQFLYIVLTFLGSAVAFADDSHIAITTVTEHLSEKKQKIIRSIGRIILLPFFFLMLIGTFQNVKYNMIARYSTMPWMKRSYLYMNIAISVIIIIYYIFKNLYLELFPENKLSYLIDKKGDK